MSKKVRRRKATIPGSYRAQRELATSEADDIAAQHAGDDQMKRLCVHIAQAFEAATAILFQARAAEPPPAVEFVARQVRLAEHARRIDELLTSDNVRDAYARWPREPGLTFGSKAGDSALDVARRFVAAVNNATLYTRNEVARGPAGSTTYDDLPVYPDTDARFDAWRDRTLAEVAERTVGPDLLRSPGEIHRDAGSLTMKLRAELAGYQANPVGDDACAAATVTLDQAAAIVGRAKSTLKKRKDLPEPDIRGNPGQPNEWRWTTIRPWLEDRFNRRLPDAPHGSRILG